MVWSFPEDRTKKPAPAKRAAQKRIIRQKIMERIRCPICDRPKKDRYHDCRWYLSEDVIEYRKANPDWRGPSIWTNLVERYKAAHKDCPKDSQGWCAEFDCPGVKMLQREGD